MARRRSRRQRIPQEPVQLNIESLSHEGRGVARLEGKTIFVQGALPNENVSAKYTKTHKSYDEAVAIDVDNANEYRVEPPCEHADICGGCSLQHMDTAHQIEFKQSVLQELFEHAQVNEPDAWLPPLTADKLGYRSKARLGVKYVPKKGGVLVGFREKASSYITDIKSCPVLVDDVGQKIMDLREMIATLDCKDSLPQIELAKGDSRMAFIVRHMKPLSDSDQATWIDFCTKNQIDLYFQPKGPNTVHKVYPENSESRLQYKLNDFGVKLNFHPADFTQVNQSINQKMVKLAIDMLDIKPDDRVLDLFCGLGNFTIPLATKAKHVVGVEGSEAMVERGFENAKSNHLTNVHFYAADLTKDNSDQPWALEGFNKILIDPPRSGAIEVLQHIPAYAPEVIVYVSCNPATLARDAAELNKLGYKMVQAGVMDMFPHTAHVESIAKFVKIK
jgi:23S rRNA (uracil1939-C5)-methyltransferase